MPAVVGDEISVFPAEALVLHNLQDNRPQDRANVVALLDAGAEPVLTAAVGVLVLASLLAALWPAFRATRVSPQTCLRAD